MTKFLLRICDGFAWIFRRMGIDYPKFRALVWVKLTNDDRQEKSVAQKKSAKDVSRAMIWVMVIYAFMGLFAGLILLQIQDLFVALIFTFALIMVMTTVALISDFSAVLLDTTDNAILQHRPIDGRTMAVARITHIMLYLMQITLSLSLATLIIGSIKYGILFLPLFLTGLFFAVLFIVFLANVFYLFLMKISGGERFKDIILYFQIFMAAFSMGSYQILPRLLEANVLKNFSITIEWWTYLLPPAWIAAPIDAALTGAFTTEVLVLTLLGLLLPVVCVYSVVRFLAPGFNRAIMELELSGGGAGRVKRRGGLAVFLSRFVSRNPVQRAVFELVWRLSGRDRKFKLKTYPTIGYMLIIVVVIMIRESDGRILEALMALPGTKKYLLFLYFAVLLIPMTILQMRLSDQYEAAWIYHALPIATPGDILLGAIKAMLVKYGFSILVPVSLVTLLVWGPAVLDDILLVFLNLFVFTYLIAIPARNNLPFAKSYSGAKEAQKGIAGFMLLFVPGTLGGIHYGLTFVPGGVLFALPVSLLLALPFSRLIGRTQWPTIAPL